MVSTVPSTIFSYFPSLFMCMVPLIRHIPTFRVIGRHNDFVILKRTTLFEVVVILQVTVVRSRPVRQSSFTVISGPEWLLSWTGRVTCVIFCPPPRMSSLRSITVNRITFLFYITYLDWTSLNTSTNYLLSQGLLFDLPVGSSHTKVDVLILFSSYGLTLQLPSKKLYISTR